MLDCPPSLLNSTGLFDSTGTQSNSLWLAFFRNIQSGRALKCYFVALNSTSMHCHILESSEIQIPPYSEDAVVVLMVSAFEGFHCAQLRRSSYLIKIGSLHHYSPSPNPQFCNPKSLFATGLIVTQIHTCTTIQRENFEGENFCELVKNTTFVEKTFADCSFVPCQRTLRPQISWRKLSRTATKP